MTPEFAVALAPLVPALGAVLILLTGRWPNLRESVTLVTAAVTFFLVAAVAGDVMAGGRPELRLLTVFPGVDLIFRVEPLGLIFALIASFLWMPTALYAIGYMRAHHEENQTRFYACFAIAIACAIALAFSGNLLTLFLFYEILTVSTYPLVTHAGTGEAMRSGRVYLGILIGTSLAFQLPAIVMTYAFAGTLDFQAGGLFPAGMAPAVLGLLVVLFVFGIGKAAVMPFHAWLPAAMVAPTPVSALLHAVAVVKGGVFSVVKVAVFVFGLDQLRGLWGSDLVLFASGFTVVAASVLAIQQDNLKRRLAFSTIGQLSYVVMATFAIAQISVAGGIIHIAAHAFGKITLFFAAGSIMIASHKTKVSELDGIGHRMPWTMAAFTIGALSMIGLPPAAGFISKWYILGGSLADGNGFVAIVLGLSTLLSAGYFLPIIHAAYFKPQRRLSTVGAAHAAEHHADHGEAPWIMRVAQTVTAIGTLALFFYPEPLVRLAFQIVGLTP